MNIAVDFDDTYTRDPKMWDTVIQTMLNAGHRVYCVTMRHKTESEEVVNTIGRLCPVFYTGRVAKRGFMFARGVRIDVWIDDRPDFILMDAAS